MGSGKKIFGGVQLLVLCFLLTGCSDGREEEQRIEIRGWNILSDDEVSAMRVIDIAATRYNINHLEFSHHIVHELKDIRPVGRAELVNRLTAYAHQKGISEVAVWDHALYDTGYYPDEFKVYADGTQRIDLDNPQFWEWVKDDYRGMLALIPDVDAVVLTVNESGARPQEQYSRILQTEADRLIAVVDSLAHLFIDEHDLTLYVRATIRDQAEMSMIVQAINGVRHPGIRIVVKEVMQDFYLTHPISSVPDSITKFPVIIEIDAAHEFSGQGIVASVFPEVHLKRWKEHMSETNVIGYVARTDRYYDSRIIDGPCEINLFALKRGAEDPWVGAEAIYDEFIIAKYGEKALPYIKPALKKSYDIVSAMMFTLGIQSIDQSGINYSSEMFYVSLNPGKWQRKMECYVEHDVNKTFHYWKDIANHLCPEQFKKPYGPAAKQIPLVFENGWLDTTEQMNMAYLNDIITEKDYGVRLANNALEEVMRAKPYIRDANEYTKLVEMFKRTEMAARAFRATAKAYFAYRIYTRGDKYRTPELKNILQNGLNEIVLVSDEIMHYPYNGPRGEFASESLATSAMVIHDTIVRSGEF